MFIDVDRVKVITLSAREDVEKRINIMLRLRWKLITINLSSDGVTMVFGRLNSKSTKEIENDE